MSRKRTKPSNVKKGKKKEKKKKKKKKKAKKGLAILALDPATHCGWAISRTIYGEWDLTPKRDEGGGMRLLRFKTKFKEVIEKEKIELVVFERPGGQHKGAIIVQSEIQGVIKEYCEDNIIPYRAYSSQELKKYATGKGNASKQAMVNAATKRLDYTGNNDNEADALWCLEIAKEEYGS